MMGKSDLADAFVELRFADFEYLRTKVSRKTQFPTWNEDFRFEISQDSDLQNEPLELRVLDYDAISYNDPIGTVFIDINPILTRDSLHGWFPMYLF